MEILLKDPPPRQIRAAFQKVQESANERAKTRTCTFPDLLVGSVRKRKSGGWEHDGGGVANNYGYRAFTTQLAVSWYTNTSGEKHVFVRGYRSQCSGRHVGSILPGTSVNFGKLPSIMMIHDVLYEMWGMRNLKSDLGKLIRSAIESDNDPTSWLVLADWADENAESIPGQYRHRLDPARIRHSFERTGEWKQVIV